MLRITERTQVVHIRGSIVSDGFKSYNLTEENVVTVIFYNLDVNVFMSHTLHRIGFFFLSQIVFKNKANHKLSK